jgi:hypothetical protein
VSGMETVPVRIPCDSINEETSPSGAKTQSTAFFDGDMFTDLDCFPTAAGKGMRVGSNGDRRAADAEEVFQVGQLEAKSGAIPKRPLNSILSHIFMRAKKRTHDIILGEFVGEEIAHVSREEIGERLEFETGNRPFALLDLNDEISNTRSHRDRGRGCSGRLSNPRSLSIST